MPSAAFPPALIFEVAWAWEPLASRYTAAFTSLSAGADARVMLGAVPGYVVGSGDCLEYDVYWPSGSQFVAVDLYNFDDGVYLRSTTAADQGGRAAKPSTDLSFVANGVWYHRVIPLPASWIGKTITRYDIACDLTVSGGSGSKTAYLRDVMISDGNGGARQLIWGQGNGLQGPQYDTTSTGSFAFPFTIDPPLAGSPSYIDLSDRVLEATIARGRQRELDQVETGTMELVCDNSDRALDPTYVSSPYYPNVLPMRMIRARAVYPLPNLLPYGGFADSISGFFGQGWTAFLGGGATLTPQASAAFEGSLGALGSGSAAPDTAAAFSLFDVPIDATQPYTLSAYFKKTAGAVNAHSRLRCVCYKADGTNAGFVSPTTATAGLTLSTMTDFDPTGSFVRYGGIIRPQDWPTGTVKCRVEASPVLGPSGAVSVAVDAIQIEYGAAVSAYSAAQNYYLFSGFIERYPSTQRGRHNEVTISCSDAFLLLNQATTNVYRPTETTDQRISSVLLDAGFPRGQIAAAPGMSSVQPLGVISGQSTEINVGQHVLDVADAELGLFFIAGDGAAIFFSRLSRQFTSSVATFYDQPTDASSLDYYVDIVQTVDPDQIYNYIAFTPFPGGSTYYAQDYKSQRKYGKRTLEGQPLVSTADDAQQRAYYLLGRYKEPVQRFDAITLDPKRRPSLWLQVLTRELGNRITVQRTPPGGGSAIVKDAYIEHLQHTLSARPNEARTWTTTYELSAADIQSYWLLAGSIGDAYAPFSILDSTTRLAY